MPRRRKAHDPEDGRFVPDNLETPEVNEHYAEPAPEPEAAPEAPEAPETAGVITPVTPKLRPEETVEEKTKEVATREGIDMSSGQRFGAKLIALAEMNRRK